MNIFEILFLTEYHSNIHENIRKGEYQTKKFDYLAKLLLQCVNKGLEMHEIGVVIFITEYVIQ